MNRCRLETIRAYWSGRVAAYSAVNADELGTIQAKVWDELIAEQLPCACKPPPRPKIRRGAIDIRSTSCSSVSSPGFTK